MSRCHTRGSIVGARKRSHFLTFSFIFARFGGFVSAVSVVSLVSVVSVVSFRSFRSFRWFRFGRFVSLFRVLVHAHKDSSLSFKSRLGNLNAIIRHQGYKFGPFVTNRQTYFYRLHRQWMQA